MQQELTNSTRCISCLKLLTSLVEILFATDQFQLKPTSGCFISYDSTLVPARSTTQNHRATSAPEAEFFEIYRRTKQLLFAKELQKAFGEDLMQVIILTNSESLVYNVHNPVSLRCEFLSVYVNFKKYHIKHDGLKAVFLPRKYNFATLLIEQNKSETYQILLRKLLAHFCWTHTTARKD